MSKWISAGLMCLAIAIGVASCDRKSVTPMETGPNTFNAEGVDIPIAVHTFDSVKELNAFKKNLDGAPEYAVEGLAQARVDVMGNVKRCDIYVVRPAGAKDYDIQLTWGHELMHCIYGLYHKEGVR